MKVSLKLTGRRDEADDVASFMFVPNDRLPYQAGQYIRLAIPHPDSDDRGTSRYFTLSSAPSERLVMITTRVSRPGSSFKRALASLREGDVVDGTGPGGRFVYPTDGPPAVFVAGGIGVTPFRSILTELAAQGVRPDICLVYANRTASIPFREHFDRLSAERRCGRVVYTISKPQKDWVGSTGRIDAAFLARSVPDLEKRDAYVSGPRPMVEGVVKELASLGLDATRIKTEVFPGYESIDE
jgi:ferredoxin-NADP reductase